jgi:hypothetical protein
MYSEFPTTWWPERTLHKAQMLAEHTSRVGEGRLGPLQLKALHVKGPQASERSSLDLEDVRPHLLGGWGGKCGVW